MISLSAMLAVTVTVSGLGTDGTANRNLIQAELNKARTLKEHLKVCIPKGTYPLSTTLFIYSNTELELSASTTFTRKGSTAHNMLFSRHLRADGELCDGDSSCKHGGYSQFSNITVSGGTWDAGEGEVDDGGIFHLCHGSGIVIRNATFKRASGHMLNLSGSRDILVENCTFRDAERYEGTDPNFWGDYEVGDEEAYKTVESVHLDVVSEEGEAGNYPTDGTPCANVTVRNCRFADVFSGVGSHHYYPGIWLKGLSVESCVFTGLVGPAVYSIGVTNCGLRGNKVSSASGLVYASYSFGDLTDNEVVNSEQDGILLYEEADYAVTGNRVIGSSRNGISVYKATARIAANAVTNSGNCALLVSTRSTASVTSNVLHGATMHGVCALGGSEVDVSGTTIGDCKENGISVEAVTQVSVRNNVMRGGKIGIYLTSVEHGVVCGNDLQGMTSFGIAATKGDVRFESNLIRGTGDFGLRLEDCSGARVERNAIEDVNTTAIYVVGGAVGMLDNRITSPHEHGVVASAGAVMTVSGNVVSSPEGTGLYFTSQSSGTVSDNEVLNAGEDGIFLYEDVDCSLTGNRLVGSARNGINVYRSKARIATNAITNSGNCAVSLSNKAKAEVTDCILQGAETHGVCALDGSEVDVLGTKIGGFEKNGIVVNDAARVCLRDNVVLNGEIGVYLKSVAHGEVCGNDLQGMTSFGIAATKGDVRFESNLIRETCGFGLRLENCSGTSVERNALENIRTTAIYVAGGAVGLLGNRIAMPAEHGILATGGAEVNVSGNSIVQPQKTGIYLVGCRNSVVDANRIADGGAKAVWLQDSSGVKISANEINAVAEEGIYCMRSTAIVAYNSVLGAGKIAIRIDGTKASKASAKVLKNIAESASAATWHDIRFVGYCSDSSAKGNIVLGKGLWVESTSTDSVAIADSCSEEDAALLDYYDVSFDVGGGTPIPRILCRQGAVYRLPKNGGKGWRGSNGRLYDDEMLVYDLVPNGQTALMSAVK